MCFSCNVTPSLPPPSLPPAEGWDGGGGLYGAKYHSCLLLKTPASVFWVKSTAEIDKVLMLGCCVHKTIWIYFGGAWSMAGMVDQESNTSSCHNVDILVIYIMSVLVITIQPYFIFVCLPFILRQQKRQKTNMKPCWHFAETEVKFTSIKWNNEMLSKLWNQTLQRLWAPSGASSSSIFRTWQKRKNEDTLTWISSDNTMNVGDKDQKTISKITGGGGAPLLSHVVHRKCVSTVQYCTKTPLDGTSHFLRSAE